VGFEIVLDLPGLLQGWFRDLSQDHFGIAFPAELVARQAPLSLGGDRNRRRWHPCMMCESSPKGKLPGDDTRPERSSMTFGCRPRMTRTETEPADQQPHLAGPANQSRGILSGPFALRISAPRSRPLALGPWPLALLRLSQSCIECGLCVSSPVCCMRKNSAPPTDWRREWRAQCQRQLARPTLARIKYGFGWVHKPVLDDGPSRAFDSMEEYRRWCHEKLPPYLGYRIAKPPNATK
jgi:hypothetical protein